MAKKAKRIVILGSALASVFGLASCGELKEAERSLSTNIIAMAARENICAQNSSYEFKGTNVTPSKEENKVDVEICGTITSNSQTYTTNFDYTVDTSYFAGVENKQDYQIINALANIVANEKYTGYDCIKINDMSALDHAMYETIECPVKNYHNNRVDVYSVDDIEFNKEKGYVAFTVDEATTFSETRMEATYGVVTYVNGKPQYGVVVRPHTYYEHFTEQHTVYVRCSEQEMSEMEQDTNKIFENFEAKVEAKDKTNYTIEAKSIEKNTDTHINYNPDRTF